MNFTKEGILSWQEEMLLTTDWMGLEGFISNSQNHPLLIYLHVYQYTCSNTRNNSKNLVSVQTNVFIHLILIWDTRKDG